MPGGTREKAQASDEEICKRAAHPSSKLNQKICRVACACMCVPVRGRAAPTYTTTCGSNTHYKPDRPLLGLLSTHVALVRAAYGSNIRYPSTCQSLLRVARGSNIFFQIMVTFLSYISNASHSLSGVAERLQHTILPTRIHSRDANGLNVVATLMGSAGPITL